MCFETVLKIGILIFYIKHLYSRKEKVSLILLVSPVILLILQMVTIKANKHKKPSRKHRRRPKNLLQEYIRRQKNKVWLETHIWHAKRFKMADKWGYKIPYQPTNKSARASYRATQHHCQMIVRTILPIYIVVLKK